MMRGNLSFFLAFCVLMEKICTLGGKNEALRCFFMLDCLIPTNCFELTVFFFFFLATKADEEGNIYIYILS